MELWSYGVMKLRGYGIMELWSYGVKGLQRYGVKGVKELSQMLCCLEVWAVNELMVLGFKKWMS